MPVRFQVDPDFYDHPKSIGLSDAATALWVRAGSYSTAKLLDGLVPENVLATLSRTPEAAADELVARGLWRRVRGGFRFHQWDERNLTRARVEADRTHDRDKKRRQRAAQRGEKTAPVDNGNTSAPQPVENGRVYGTAQVRPPIVPPGLPPGVPGESSGIPGSVPGLSVSVSVSESVSGSGPPAGPSAAPPRHAAQEPPPRCSKHIDDPNPPPCGWCADARRANERWQAERRARLAQAPPCPTHRGQLAHNCAGCRADALAGDNDALAEPTRQLRILPGGAA